MLACIRVTLFSIYLVYNGTLMSLNIVCLILQGLYKSVPSSESYCNWRNYAGAFSIFFLSESILFHSLYVLLTSSQIQPALGPDGKKKEPESNVLLASIENMQYAVTVDVLHTVRIRVNNFFCRTYFFGKFVHVNYGGRLVYIYEVFIKIYVLMRHIDHSRFSLPLVPSRKLLFLRRMVECRH